MNTDIDDILLKITDNNNFPNFPGISDKLIIYGYGNFGKAVFHAVVSRGFSVIGFLDINAKEGDRYHDTPILKPDTLRFPLEERANITVILAVHNRNVEISPIIKVLNTYGYPKVLSPVIFYDLCGEELGNRYWLTPRSYYRKHKEAIKEGMSVWKDNASKKLYLDILNYRITGNGNSPPIPDFKYQYSPADIPPWKRPLRFVDCGSFDGDTVRQFLEMGLPIQALAAFEPDPNNFQDLVHFIREEKNEIDEISLWPCGVYESTIRVSFSSGMGESARISPEGKVQIQCISLDDAIPRFRPNLIKMDIEGVEYNALMGARKIIKENTPGLAICVYHHPADLWRIPLMIRQWDCGYEFYLRLHAYNGFDLVMYAVKS